MGSVGWTAWVKMSVGMGREQMLSNMLFCLGIDDDDDDDIRILGFAGSEGIG